MPKETVNKERRVALSPEGVKKLKNLGYDVRVESGAGKESQFSDEMYSLEGADIVQTKDIY